MASLANLPGLVPAGPAANAEFAPVLTVPSRHRLLLKDSRNVRIQDAEKKSWQVLSFSESLALDQYLMESPDKKSWKIPNSSCRIGFNDAGVFYQQDHKKRYFGMLETAARHLVPTVATTEAIPLYHKRQSDNPIIDKLEEKVKTITDEMRGKVIRSTFRAADTNKNGTLSRHEIGTLIRRLAVTATTAEIEELMREADANRDGQIDYEEFCASVSLDPYLATLQGTSADVVRASFRAWDANGNGLISQAEVQKVLREACGLTQKECEILASVMDTDDDGQIDYDEFVAFLYPPER
ncbi:unnamed protein product [Durusdinium trenchii]|uniref:EF-hand domain-containing protein n=1 Tax=Durusdinium trenchii TaxID=1381693 RepID=A0ABP0Q4Z0_9DINO